jgi:lipopolysaccharide transport system ATP-binding protein
MSRTVISVENLGKEYVIGGREAVHETFREMMVSAAAAPFRRLRRLSGKATPEESIWALQDVSFEVKEGEVVGIIGRNGAGKSTLLKILSRITEPTEGRVEILGRMASLLEVGTGFHQELTGRENIYLNGAIMGMSRTEIDRKFDAIVDFSGVERFLDTPVKRYSSGMSVRLAFAVAAHLESDILIVDEVLAVGDAEFQNKCMGKMQDVAGHGRTVLFVSHNLQTVIRLCRAVLILTEGRASPIDTDVEMQVRRYLSSQAERNHSRSFKPDTSKPSIIGVNVDSTALSNRDLFVDITFVSPSPLPAAVGGIVLSATAGGPVWGSNSRFHSFIEEGRGLSRGILRCEARGLPIAPGQYVLSVWLGSWHEDYDAKIDILSFFVGLDISHASRPPSSIVGHVDWPAVWRTMPVEPSPAG